MSADQILTSLAIDINIFCQSDNRASLLNPIAIDIISKAHMSLKPALFVMAISLLRFSDAKMLLKKFPLLPPHVLFKQGKTKHFVSLDFSNIPTFLLHNIFIASKKIDIFNYANLSTYLSTYSRFHLKSFNLSFNSKTHIFRHLQASFLNTQKCNSDFIKKKLGHFDNHAIKSYIHKELFA
jgi:hypothetical protein